MSNEFILFQNVTFAYDTSTSQLLLDISASFPRGWTGIVGANGVGKSTLLKLAAGILKPGKGKISGPEIAIYCRQRTDEVPDMLDTLIESNDGNAHEISGRLGIENDWPKRWETLSHGERKRAQIGVAVWYRPQILAVDEPTNHLDFEAQKMLRGALESFRGIGLLVSHDRELLDSLCKQCLFIDPPGTILHPGGYTGGLQQVQKDLAYAQKQHTLAKRTYVRLKREVSKRRDKASQSLGKRSKRGLSKKDSDAREKIDMARVSGKDGVDGKLLRQLEGQLEKARTRRNNIEVKKNYDMGIWMTGAKSKRNTLFRLESESILLGGDRRLILPDLAMKPDDRIALTGTNGSGKSTLIRHIVKSLNITEAHLTYLPQEIDMGSAQDIMAKVRNLPKDKLGQMMTVLSRLGSRPHRLLESNEPSPGEIRKILLAKGIAGNPHLIIMDEPTNHLDLPSIECLENALVNCPCGLLLVSHDRRFLDRLTGKRWHISREHGKSHIFVLHEL